jgi:hypothetical protein
MSREARILLILLLMALGAVGVLGMMAKRYGGVLEARDSAADAAGPMRLEEAPAAVEGFIVVRRAMRERVDAFPESPPDRDALAKVRLAALAAAGLREGRYISVRTGYRAWRKGALPGGPLLSALDLRRARLDDVDLGRYESIDL